MKRNNVATSFKGVKSVTKQSFKKQTDVNHILKTSGVRKPFTVLESPLTRVPDLQTVLNSEINFRRDFMRLPATLRYHFHNDHLEFFHAVNDPARKDELIELGLLRRPKPVEGVDPKTGKKVDVQTGKVVDDAPASGVPDSSPAGKK